VRTANRTAVLLSLLVQGSLHRSNLARLTGLSSAGVTNVVTELLGEGLLIEAGTEESDGGRPRVLLRLNPDFGIAIGIDVGETGVRVGAFDLSMTELFESLVPIHPAECDVGELVMGIAGAVEGVRRAFPGRNVLGVGVALPGIVEHTDEDLVHAPNIGWDRVPLARLLREEMGLPVLLENGAKTLGQAEVWFGAGRGARYVVAALLGTGVGAAVFADGSLYRGSGSSAGEWGHMTVDVGGRRCRCGRRGCLEAYLGAESLLERWAERTADAARLTSVDDEEAMVEKLLAEISTGRAGRAFLDETVGYLGAAAANLVNLFNPERIVLGGWLGIKLGPLVLDPLRKVMIEQALPYPASQVSIEIGQLGRDAVALGASTLVVHELLASRL
jgi:predicted NBD/HSP70 family sugar kinase